LDRSALGDTSISPFHLFSPLCRYDPYAEYIEEEEAKERKKKELIKQAKEEKERIRLEKKQKRDEERERKKREREEKKNELQRTKEEKKKEAVAAKEKEKAERKAEKKKEKKEKVKDKKEKEKSSKKDKPPKKKLKKVERKRAAKRAEWEDPVLERIKQAWEVPQRNRATAAALRFGFGRLCKIRHESNLTSLPIQDVEIFVRAYCYQLGAQAAVCMMKQLCNKNGETSDDHAGDIASFLMRGAGSVYRADECVFIVRAVESALKLQEEVHARRRTLRIPLILTEQSYVSELRSGGALRALLRLAFLSRLNTLVEECLDNILADLGHEELGKRGCSIKDLSTLDIDLKSRHVSTEELSHALGMGLSNQHSLKSSAISSLAPWWNRNCDLALMVGTFIHGLGNYEAMRNDEELPFGRRIAEFTTADPGSAQAFRNFTAATTAARKVYDDALTAFKSKAQLEAHEAVAAVLAAASKGNKEKSDPPKEKVKNKNPEDSSEVPVPGNESKSPTPAKPDDKTTKKVRDESEKITLLRLSSAVVSSMRVPAGSTNSPKDEIPLHQCLPMPNARYLDHLLLNLVDKVTGGSEENARLDAPTPCIPSEQNGLAPFVDAVASNVSASKKAYSMCGINSFVDEESFRGHKCGSYHRSLADGSDYGSSAASSDLAAITSGADASRYQRGSWVPLLVTRYGLGALIYADTSVLDAMSQNPSKEDVPKSGASLSKEESAASSAKPPSTEENRPDEKEKGHSNRKKLSGLMLHIPSTLLRNPQLRGSICAVALCYGMPISSKRKPWQEVQGGILTGNALGSFLSMTTIVAAIGKVSATGVSLQEKDVRIYLDQVLIPHCVRLCLFEPGKSKEKSKANTLGNESMVLWESTKPGRCGLKTPLPDPCIPLKYHSEESIANAFAILRRIRLSRAVQFVVGGGVQRSAILAFLQSPVVRGGMEGLPIWWCPWVHDVAILVHAAAHGLFAIIHDHKDQGKLRKLGSVFERNTLERYIRTVFVEGMEGRSPALPKCFLNKSTAAELDAWVKAQALQFPTAHVLERRMALICAEMTKHSSSANQSFSSISCTYQNIPMFDHGGWPMNE